MPFETELVDAPSAPRIDNDFKYGARSGVSNGAYAVDRHWIDEQRLRFPDLGEPIQRALSFTIDVVRASCRAEITQFLDLGCGNPGYAAVHRIAQDHSPTACVLAVDQDPWIAMHWDLAPDGGGLRTRFAEADLRDTETVLRQAHAFAHFDLTRPVTVMLIEVLHYLNPSDARAVLEHYFDEVAPGSRLVLTQRTVDGASPARAAQAADLAVAYAELGAPMWLRTHAETAALLGAWAPLRPGITSVRTWPLLDSPAVADDLGALSWAVVAEKPR